MCGLVGFLGGVAGVGGDDILLRRMADTLIHRITMPGSGLTFDIYGA